MARGDLTFGDDAPREEAYVNDALAALGLYAVDEVVLEVDEFWLWPDSEEPFELWLGLQTQWNVGMGGAIGLLYPGVEACMRMRGIRPGERQRMFGLVQQMEQACLEEWAKKRRN